MNKELRHRFDAEVERAFCATGWRRRNRKTYTRPIADDIDAQVGLEDSAAGEWLHVIVWVSVRHNEVHRIIAALEGRKPHAYDPATFGYPLSHFTPNKWESYFLISEQGVTAIAEKIHELVERYGGPFWEKHGSLEAIVAAIDEPDFHGLRKTRAVLYYMAGDLEQARRYVTEELAALKDPSWAGYFDVFAERFCALLDGQRHTG